VLSVLALVAAATSAPTAGARTPASDWTSIAHGHPSGQSSYLYDAWGDGTDVWAAGVRQIPIGGVIEWRTWLQRCSGAAGTCQLQNTRDVEAAPSYTFLQGVSGSSATDVWTVGYAERPRADVGTLAEHFDGTTWTIVPTPVDHGALYAVSAIAHDDVWAVGEDNREPFREKPLAMHWNGSSWIEDSVKVR
jgi:hypothetical protein